MIADKINKLNKTEKNKKVKEGPCIFPFKYQWKTHQSCIETPKGEICATEINPKTRTLIKYGYCKTFRKASVNFFTPSGVGPKRFAAPFVLKTFFPGITLRG